MNLTYFLSNGRQKLFKIFTLVEGDEISWKKKSWKGKLI